MFEYPSWIVSSKIRFLNVNALLGAINKEKGVVGALSVIVKLSKGLLTALVH